MTEKSRRFYLDKSNPRVWKALNSFGFAITQAADEAGVDRDLLELMYVRISQINGCLFCLDLHTRRSVEKGLPNELLAQLPAWEESHAFTEHERAVLAVGEAVTNLPPADERRATLAAARAVLGDDAFAAVEWAAIGMNAYNRVSIVSEHPAPDPRA